jgi:hypothetical protein
MPTPGVDARFSLRRPRLLTDLALFVAIIALLAWLRLTADGIQRARSFTPASLDFEIIQERLASVERLQPSQSEVEKWLGPPTQRGVWESEVKEWEAKRFKNATPPGDHVWEKWTDPKDKGKWVAILFMDGQYYHMITKGF